MCLRVLCMCVRASLSFSLNVNVLICLYIYMYMYSWFMKKTKLVRNSRHTRWARLRIGFVEMLPQSRGGAPPSVERMFTYFLIYIYIYIIYPPLS